MHFTGNTRWPLELKTISQLILKCLHCINYARIKVFTDRFSPVQGQNCRPCPYTREYGSVGTCILTLFCVVLEYDIPDYWNFERLKYWEFEWDVVNSLSFGTFCDLRHIAVFISNAIICNVQSAYPVIPNTQRNKNTSSKPSDHIPRIMK